MRAHILEQYVAELQGLEQDIMGRMKEAREYASDDLVAIPLRLTRVLLGLITELRDSLKEEQSK